MTRQADTLRRILEEFLLDVHTALPGRVQSYDAASQTADVEIGIRRVLPARDPDSDDDTSEAYPILVGVPVAWPRGGGFRAHFPLAAGDGVLLVFPEGAIDRWLDSGDVSDPGLPTRHGIDGAVAIPGLGFRGGRISSAPTDGAVFGKDGAGPGVKVTASQVQAGGTEDLSEASDVITHLTAIKADLDAIAAFAGTTSIYNLTGLLVSAPIRTTVTKGT